MFNSNTQPKRILKSKPDPWYCHHCDVDVAAWWTKCPDCKTKRGE